MTPELLDSLAATRTIDLTTFGRRSGQPSTVEIWWFRINGRFIVTGTPGPRDWLANIRANHNVLIDVNGRQYEATATEVTDQGLRRQIFTDPDTSWYSSQSGLERLVEVAPMIEIVFASS